MALAAEQAGGAVVVSMLHVAPCVLLGKQSSLPGALCCTLVGCGSAPSCLPGSACQLPAAALPLPLLLEVIDGQQRVALCQFKSLGQSLMCFLRGATSPDSEAPCAAPLGQVIDSSIIFLNGSCIGIQCHLRIRETRSLALIGPPCVR